MTREQMKVLVSNDWYFAGVKNTKDFTSFLAQLNETLRPNLTPHMYSPQDSLYPMRSSAVLVSPAKVLTTNELQKSLRGTSMRQSDIFESPHAQSDLTHQIVPQPLPTQPHSDTSLPTRTDLFLKPPPFFDSFSEPKSEIGVSDPLPRPVQILQPEPEPTKDVQEPGKVAMEPYMFDEDLNALAATLRADKMAEDEIQSTLKALYEDKMMNKRKQLEVEEQHTRLMGRFKLFGLKEKANVPADGNCQFHALSSQIYDDFVHSKQIRAEIVQWMREHGTFSLGNGTILADYCPMDSWKSYCDYIARDGIWGDHLTLVAACVVYNAKVLIVSSVDGEDFVSEIEVPPQPNQSPLRALLLSHYAEFHYGSLVLLKDV